MAEDDGIGDVDPRLGRPTWSDLAEFINKQAENDRNVINFWFKLASALIGFILVAATVAVTLFGLKTISDAKATAEAAARYSAKARVEEVLKEPELQNLVRETARDLYAKGAFRNEIEAKVRELISAEIATPESRKLIGEAIRRELAIRTAARVLTELQVKTIADSLRSAPEGKVLIRTGTLPEQQGYARKLFAALQTSPSWKAHVSYAEPGTLAVLAANMNLLLEGIVVVVNDPKTAPDSARALEKALKNAGIVGVRLGPCNCSDPPKPPDIWLYVGEKNY